MDDRVLRQLRVGGSVGDNAASSGSHSSSEDSGTLADRRKTQIDQHITNGNVGGQIFLRHKAGDPTALLEFWVRLEVP